jgi:uncharacterized short protein YbdD (DUF466 family)
MRDSTRLLLQQVLSTVRQVAGMPDYAAHVDHLRRVHPDYPIPSEHEYFDQFVRTRYEDGPTRCC